MKNKSNMVHVFEEAGLGKAPFRFTHVEVQHTGCQFCGTAIAYKFYIRSADNKVFFVGSDCVYKTGDRGLVDPVKREVNRMRNAARHEKEAAIIRRLMDHLNSDSVQSDLKAKPHPNKYFASQGKTLYDYTLWMVQHSGNAGSLRIAKSLGVK